MKKINYDNAFTRLDEEREIDLLLKEFRTVAAQLHSLENNKLLTENEKLLLEVSLWDKAKYLMSKLGRYKAGGKIFGKSKTDQEAGAKIQQIIDKKGNEMIKDLHSGIQKANSEGKGEFPNNQDPDIFLNIILSISQVYDGIVAATKLKPEEKGYLPVDAANNVISDLREYVKKYLDVDLKAAYSVMDSEEDKVNPNPEEEEEDVLITDSEEPIEEDRESDVRGQLKAKKGENAEQIDSERMKTLKSWRLPLALMGAGASFGALSWLIEYIFPAEKITSLTPEEFKEVTEKTIGHVKPGDGMTQTFNAIPELGANLTPQSSPDEVVDVLSKIGNGNPQAGVDILTQSKGIFQDPELAHNTLSELVKNPHGHGDTLEQVFKGDWAGTGKQAGDTLVTLPGGTLKMMMLKAFIRWGTKTTIKKSAIVLFGGPILKTLGVGLLGGGALVKLFREKGKRQSRAATLNDLLQSLQFVKGETVLPDTPQKGDEDNDIGDKGGKFNKEQFYIDLTSFFQFTHNNRKMASSDVFGGGEASDIEVGKEYFFTNKKGEKNVVKVVSLSNQYKAGGDKKFGTDDDEKLGDIEPGTAFVVFKKPDNTYGNEPARAVNKKQLSNENTMMKKNIITEGKFIKDPQVIKILKDTKGIDQNRLKFFEGFLTRLEIIRNKIKKAGSTGDSVMDGFIQKMKSNPIMTKDFVKTFRVDPNNQQNVEHMGDFINDIIEIVYKGRFRGKTFNDIGGMINKMGKLGGGNINKVSTKMGESYILERKGKKAQAKSAFKNHIIEFITQLMGLFQYMTKLKREGRLGSSGDSSSKKVVPKIGSQQQEESIKKVNTPLMEEISRIKKLMK